MKAEHEINVRYRVEVQCLNIYPMTGLLLPENTAIQHAHYILAALPSMDAVQEHVKGGLEITRVKLYKKVHGKWLLQYQYAPTEGQRAKRIANYQEAADKLGVWREDAAPGDVGNLAEILGDTPL